jgi:Spy/CpxP family protein refolding chaperone
MGGPGMGGPGMMQGGQGFGGAHDDLGGPGSLMPMGHWWKRAEVAKTLGLNDDQVQKIEQIFLDSRLKLIDAHANLQKEEVKLMPLIAADNPDEKAVLSAIDRITAARASEGKTFAEMAFAVRRVLTPEQWKKLRAMHPMRGHFPPPCGGPRGGMEHHMHDGDSHQHMHDGGPGHKPTPPAADQGTAPTPNK